MEVLSSSFSSTFLTIKFEMDGFGLNSNTMLDSATLDKYVNCVQTVKRDIANSIL